MRSLPPMAHALVCLDLQRGRQNLNLSAEAAMLDACLQTLTQARALRWPVLHVHSRTEAGAAGRSIAGLEPLPSEAVYVRNGPSPFSNRNFSQAVQALGGPLALIGYRLNDTVLATAFAAADRDLDCQVLSDAIAIPQVEGLGPRHPLRGLAPAVNLITSSELFQQGARRFAAANMP